MAVLQPRDLHRATEAAFNSGDVDALVALYVEDACLVDHDGSVAAGADAIRAMWSGFVSLGGQIAMTTRYCVERGDVALLSNTWEFRSGSTELTSTSAEVAVRGSDGTWRYLIDNPTGGATPQ
jgi:uncharacterized protein (TIGR02246 family)